MTRYAYVAFVLSSSLLACEDASRTAVDDETGIGIGSTGAPAHPSGEDDVGEASGDSDDGGDPDGGDDPAPEPDIPPPVLGDPSPPPISGGTLTLSRDESLAFVVDSARDLLVVVAIDDVSSPQVVHEIAFEAGAEPGRATEDDAGLLHVAMRRAGTVVTVDPNAGDILTEHEVCGSPRGVAADPSDGSLLVACAEGLLARIQVDGIMESFDLGRDLRDIVDVGPPMRVSTFRDASVLTVADDGTIVAEDGPPSLAFSQKRFVGPAAAPSEAPDEIAFPNTARRTYRTDDGGWLMLHQVAKTSPLQVGAKYGDGTCIPLQATVVTRWFPDADAMVSLPIEAMAVGFDMAASTDEATRAVVGHSVVEPAVAFVGDDDIPETIGQCVPWVRATATPPGTPISIAIDGDDRMWVQTLEPAMLTVYEGVDAIGQVELSSGSVLDTGHALFHEPTSSLLACVSCHPEGGEDGLVWDLPALGLRRTIDLRGGLEGTEPFHWAGDLPTMLDLVEEVRHKRMSGPKLDEDYAAALEHWLFSLPAASLPPTDPDEVTQGEALFVDAGCATCHVGPQFTSGQTVPLPWSTPLQVPRLRGVGLRPPYMHDGRAPDLASATVEMLTISPSTIAVGPDEVDLIVEFMRAQ